MGLKGFADAPGIKYNIIYLKPGTKLSGGSVNGESAGISGKRVETIREYPESLLCVLLVSKRHKTLVAAMYNIISCYIVSVLYV